MVPAQFITIGTRVFFAATTGPGGRELFVTTGTKAFRVKDIRVGPDGSDPGWLARVGKRLFFAANDGVHDQELWMWKP